MKKQTLSLSLIAFCFTLVLFSCQKNNKGEDNFSDEATTQSDDQSQVSGLIDDVSTEINGVLEQTGTLAMRGGELQDVCGISLTIDSANAIRTATLTYNGPDCLGRFTRTGVVKVSIPAGVHWKDAGAIITVQYQNLQFTSATTNRSLTINGTVTITNVSGGLLYQLSGVNSIVHRINSDGITVTFGNNNQRTWKIARQRTFTYDNGFVLSITGTHTEGNITGVSEWGTNRNGRPFVSAIAEPVVIRQDCLYRITSGKITHTLPAFNASATFGLNQAGAPATCPGINGHYYVKIEWAITGGASQSGLYPY